MKKSRFTEEQVAYALRQVESGTPVAEVIRKLGVTEQTFYRWKRRFAGMGVAELRRLRQLEEENRKLKKLEADRSSSPRRWISGPIGGVYSWTSSVRVIPARTPKSRASTANSARSV